MDFDPFNFDADRKRSDHFITAARKAAKGLAPEQLVPGALVTMSSCKATGDRSWTQDIWEVVAANAGTVVVKPTGLCEKPYFSDPRAIQIHEREFYSAEHLAEVLRQTQAA